MEEPTSSGARDHSPRRGVVDHDLEAWEAAELAYAQRMEYIRRGLELAALHKVQLAVVDTLTHRLLEASKLLRQIGDELAIHSSSKPKID